MRRRTGAGVGSTKRPCAPERDRQTCCLFEIDRAHCQYTKLILERDTQLACPAAEPKKSPGTALELSYEQVQQNQIQT